MNRTSLLAGARLAAMVAAAAVVASMLSVWGPDASVRPGPPATWERAVVGALLLTAIAASALLFFGKKLVACIIAVAASAVALIIAVHLYRSTGSSGFVHLVQGRGWMLMAIGGGLSLAASACALFASLRTQQKQKKKRH